MTEGAPPIAFLGFCDRAEKTITKGHQIFWHRNIMGLSFSRVFHILPVSLRGQMIATAVFRPRPGDVFQLIFRCPAVNKEFDLILEISDVRAEHRIDSKPVERDQVKKETAGSWSAFQSVLTCPCTNAAFIRSISGPTRKISSSVSYRSGISRRTLHF